MERQDVYRLIDGERVYQERKFPGHVHKPAAYLTYLWHYYRKMEEVDSTVGLTTAHHAAARANMRKFAALCVACLQYNGCRDVYDWKHLPLPTAQTVYGQIDNVLSHPARFIVNEFGEFLTLLRYSLTISDKFCVDGSSATADNILGMATIEVRCMEIHGAPAREGV